MIRKNTSGQVLLPGLAAIVMAVALFIAYIGWAQRALWQMRMDTAADAAALSAARAQAQMLSYIATSNTGINLFIQKGHVPGVQGAVGVMQESAIAGYEAWHEMLEGQVAGFRTFPPAVGQVVSRLNGGEGLAVYDPRSLSTHLTGQTINTAILLGHPPYIVVKRFDSAYYTRDWSPEKTKAQPDHTTFWSVSHQSIHSIAWARLWLDVKPGSLLNDGGFPRAKENWLRDVLIQCFYPQFNARLIKGAVR